ncbi:HDOD domain-containing protein [Derxia gummosa]|uniref:HDOD domain-containing protein n=1 Tax=Derxia gummosa DSM 723 TaxID=1121388 RepID=A0A8B6X734_9BURK|nr:HDOD domain-containing protein [Derxia gummosa]
MRLETLFKQPHALPAIPKVVHELIASFDQEDIPVDAITAKLAADAALTAKLLRMANSTHFHVSKTIGTVQDAVLMLGFMNVRTLVISSGLTAAKKPLPGIDMQHFWRYSLHTAVVARWLAGPAGVNAEIAFTAGLMNAIGELVMHSGMPAEMLEVAKHADALDARRPDIERTSFGYDHSAVSAELARQWKFPHELVEALRGCVDPLGVTPASRLAAVVHIAAWRARCDEKQMSQEEIDATFPATVAESVGLSPDLVLRRMPALATLAEGLEALVN